MTFFNHLRTKIFYGWWIVAAAIVCLYTSVSVGTVSVGIFLEPVIAELGWSVWQYTLGPSLALGIGALVGIYAGQVLDRRGPQILIRVGAGICGLCFLGLAWQSELWTYWLLHILAGALGWNLFGPLTINSTVTKWFVKRRGWALAIGSIGVSLGGIITPILLTNFVDSSGWRAGYAVLGGFILLVIFPISWVMRRTPEDMGLLPDGAERTATSATVRRAKTGVSLTRAEALRTSGFWLLAVGFGLIFSAMMSVLTHAVPFVTEAGFTRGTAALALTVNGFGNLSSKAVWGYSLQRFEPRWLIMLAYSLASVGIGLMLLAAWWGFAWLLYPGFFLYGFGFGGTIPLSEFIWAKYFGREHIGSIRGVGQLISIVGPTAMPVLIGYWFDVAGTYTPAFLVIIGLYLSGAALVLLSREPSPV